MIKLKKKTYYRAIVVAGASIGTILLLIVTIFCCYIKRKLRKYDKQIEQVQFKESKVRPGVKPHENPHQQARNKLYNLGIQAHEKEKSGKNVRTGGGIKFIKLDEDNSIREIPKVSLF